MVVVRYVSRSWYGFTANAQYSFSLHALNYITKLPPPTTINCVFATFSLFISIFKSVTNLETVGGERGVQVKDENSITERKGLKQLQ